MRRVPKEFPSLRMGISERRESHKSNPLALSIAFRESTFRKCPSLGGVPSEKIPLSPSKTKRPLRKSEMKKFSTSNFRFLGEDSPKLVIRPRKKSSGVSELVTGLASEVRLELARMKGGEAAPPPRADPSQLLLPIDSSVGVGHNLNTRRERFKARARAARETLDDPENQREKCVDFLFWVGRRRVARSFRLSESKLVEILVECLAERKVNMEAKSMAMRVDWWMKFLSSQTMLIKVDQAQDPRLANLIDLVLRPSVRKSARKVEKFGKAERFRDLFRVEGSQDPNGSDVSEDEKTFERDWLCQGCSLISIGEDKQILSSLLHSLLSHELKTSIIFQADSQPATPTPPPSPRPRVRAPDPSPSKGQVETLIDIYRTKKSKVFGFAQLLKAVPLDRVEQMKPFNVKASAFVNATERIKASDVKQKRRAVQEYLSS